MKAFLRTFCCALILMNISAVCAFSESPYTIFDDKMLLEGYADKYKEEPADILLTMIRDENLTSYKVAAAVRVFRKNYATKIFKREKRLAERDLLRRFNRTSSPFVEIEIMHTLLVMDRYKYFKAFIPDLIRMLDHYNKTVNEIAYLAIEDTIKQGHNRAREARIVFNTLRKILFLSRKKLENTTEPGPKLRKKLEILRWSIKILGTEELKKLPPEVMELM